MVYHIAEPFGNTAPASLENHVYRTTAQEQLFDYLAELSRRVDAVGDSITTAKSQDLESMRDVCRKIHKTLLYSRNSALGYRA